MSAGVELREVEVAQENQERGEAEQYERSSDKAPGGHAAGAEPEEHAGGGEVKESDIDPLQIGDEREVIRGAAG